MEGKYELELKELLAFLNCQSYPYLSRINRLKSLLQISVQNFLSVMAFLGNISMIQMRKKQVFPRPYSREKKLSLTIEERKQILIKLLPWQRELKCSNMSKGQLESELLTYAKSRADFLIAARNQVWHMLKTPEMAAKTIVPRHLRRSVTSSLPRRCMSQEDFNKFQTLATNNGPPSQEINKSKDSAISISTPRTTAEAAW